MNQFSHFDDSGAARMVDVGGKESTSRAASASGRVTMHPATLEQIFGRQVGKGDVLGIARIAGIMAAKRTSEWIPLCHPLALDGVDLSFERCGEGVLGILATVRCQGRTGVEMEALTSVSAAALTVYDMCKSIDRGMTIESVCLQSKSGGSSGGYCRQDAM